MFISFLAGNPMATASNSKTKGTVFYSWQSDLPNATNRGLILDALERAVKKVSADHSLTVEPVVDRDTQDVLGAPDIADTILEKIEKATAFVADVSIINPGTGRPAPNPNVLIELGYALALRTLGKSRIVLIMNTANAPVESLPFDLRSKRVLTYHLPSGAENKPEQRKKLQEGLEAALRSIIGATPAQELLTLPLPSVKALQSIEDGADSQGPYCAKVVPGIAKRISELTPELVREKIDQWDEQLVQAIQQSLPLVTDFARVAEAGAIHNSPQAALGLFRGFAPLFTQYNLPPTFSGSFYEVQFDLPKFIGHELVVTLFAALIAEQRWQMVTDLCRATVAIPNASTRYSSETQVSCLYASEYVKLLDHRNQRLRLNRVSLHADILKERHEGGELGELSPWRQFQDADVFLYLRSALALKNFSLFDVWRPWSAALLAGTPGFLLEATYRDKAEELLEPLGVKNLDELRSRLKERLPGLVQIFGHRNFYSYPFQGLNLDLIGTK
jgi:hypothetical protein